MLLALQRYDLDVTYRPGEQQVIADTCQLKYRGPKSYHARSYFALGSCRYLSYGRAGGLRFFLGLGEPDPQQRYHHFLFYPEPHLFLIHPQFRLTFPLDQLNLAEAKTPLAATQVHSPLKEPPRLMPVGASCYPEMDPMLLRHMKGEPCPAASSSCHTCGLEGHFARVCIKSGKAIVKKGKGKQVNSVETETREGTASSGEEESRVLNTIRAIKSVSAKVEVQLNGRPITMLYDPGASRSIISKRMWIKIGSPPLKPTSSLVAYTNVTVDTCGEAVVAVKLKEKVQHLAVVVVRKHDFPLFGLDWCLSFGLELPSVVRLDSVNQLGEPQKQSEIELEALISEYQELFGDDLGVIKGHKAVVHLKSNITPKVYSARPLPFAMKESVEIELRRLVDKSIIEPVNTQSHPVEWASPIVCVRKASSAIRICGDFKATLNPCIYVDPHPLPRFEDLMSKITGSKHFTKIDLSEAYLQMEVDEQSRKYFVIATHIGYFQYKRLPFGVNFAPAYFVANKSLMQEEAQELEVIEEQ
ncbi:hypothetical protein EMCRGX_G019561 [Ephydatia muelleri]